MIKRTVEQLLFHGGPASLSRLFAGGRTLVLAYHNIVPEGAEVAGEKVLHLPVETFRQHLDLLAAKHEVVGLGQIFTSSARGNGSKPRIVITFDDAYRGAVTTGVQELVKRNLPATLFVAPLFVGGRAFWWDVYGATPESDSWEAFRSKALSDWKGDIKRIQRNAGSFGLEENELSSHELCATMDEIREAASHPEVTVASHGWSHLDMTQLDRDELRREIERPLEWLSENFPESSMPWLAYPYGHSTHTVEVMAKRSGYEAAFGLSDNSWIPSDSGAKWRLPRFSIPRGISRAGFGLRVAGL